MNLGSNQINRSPAGIKSQHLLLRDLDFVSNSETPSFERRALACEASALTPEPTAQNPIYFSPKNQLCKGSPLGWFLWALRAEIPELLGGAVSSAPLSLPSNHPKPTISGAPGLFEKRRPTAHNLLTKALSSLIIVHSNTMHSGKELL